MSTDRLHISSSELDVERLMHEIRQNVTRQASESLPQVSDGPRAPEGLASLRWQPAFQPNRDNKYHVDDLLKFHGEDFVRNAYRALLLRDPDDAGLAHNLQSLGSGRFNKVDVLASLHYSPEGQQSGVTVTGLSTPATVRRLGRIPIIGYLLRMIIADSSIAHFVAASKSIRALLIVSAPANRRPSKSTKSKPRGFE